MWTYLLLRRGGAAHSAELSCAVLQVADMATQTAPLPQMLARTGSGAEDKEAQTALYGVNAVMANSSRAANGGLLQGPCRGKDSHLNDWAVPWVPCET